MEPPAPPLRRTAASPATLATVAAFAAMHPALASPTAADSSGRRTTPRPMAAMPSPPWRPRAGGGGGRKRPRLPSHPPEAAGGASAPASASVAVGSGRTRGGVDERRPHSGGGTEARSGRFRGTMAPPPSPASTRGVLDCEHRRSHPASTRARPHARHFDRPARQLVPPPSPPPIRRAVAARLPAAPPAGSRSANPNSSAEPPADGAARGGRDGGGIATTARVSSDGSGRSSEAAAARGGVWTGDAATANANANANAGGSAARPWVSEDSAGSSSESSEPPAQRRSDDATVTRGLLALVDRLHRESALTCAGGGGDPGLRGSGGRGGDDRRSHPFDHSPLHYGQHDNWSCGFRNLQMLVSALLPEMRLIFPSGVPPLDELQRSLEALWDDGFDRAGADHHGRIMAGKTSWIGTVEVWSYLTYRGVDATIVQFVKTPESRACLGGFVWAYFSKAIGPDGCQCSDDPCLGIEIGLGGGTEEEDRAAGKENLNPLAVSTVSSLEYARTILGKSYSDLRRGNGNGDGGSAFGESYRLWCRCSLPPLYLQWEGHSVTIVGVRKAAPDGQIHFVVFDPLKKGVLIREELLLGATKTVGKGDGELRRRFFPPRPRDSAPEANTTAAAVPGKHKSLLEIPARRLLGKDSQILLCTARTLETEERDRRRTKIAFATAHPAKASGSSRRCPRSNSAASAATNAATARAAHGQTLPKPWQGRWC